MYLVRDKANKNILHINPAPVSQALAEQEVYFDFDANTMEIGKTDTDLPEDFIIDAQGDIIELSLQEKVKQGIIVIEVDEKVLGEQIVKKTTQEQVDEGLITIQAHEKVEHDHIVEMSFAEQVAAELVELSNSQKIVDGEVVNKTIQELFEQGIITLDDLKQQQIMAFSFQALNLRSTILPDHKVLNALLGIYEDKKTQIYKKIIEDFRNEFYRLKAEVEKAKTIDAIKAITEKFPTILGANNKSTTKAKAVDDKDNSKKSKDKKTKLKKKK